MFRRRGAQIDRRPQVMKRLTFTLAGVFVCLAICAGCANTGTPEQREAARVRRGKNVAKLEGFGWRVLTTFGRLATGVLVNTATNIAVEQLGRGTKGFAK